METLCQWRASNAYAVGYISFVICMVCTLSGVILFLPHNIVMDSKTDRPEPIVLSLDSKKEEIADEEEWYEEALRHKNNILDSKPIHTN